MSAQEWLGLVLTSLSILALVASAVKWYIKAEFRPLQDAIEEIRKETKTNGGSSMRDEIKSIKIHQEHDQIIHKETSDKLDHMYDILINYIRESVKR